MIVIDFSQLVFNNLFIIKNAKKPKKGMVQRTWNSDTFKLGRESVDSKEIKVEESLNLLKHLIINQILSIVNLYKDETEIVLASDNSSWRKNIFQDATGNILYKAERKRKRDEDDFDWKTFWEKFSEFQEEIQKHFPFIYVSARDAEGDDVIGTLAEYVNQQNHLTKKNEKFIIISSDKDFIQLQRYKNVIQYSPKSKKEIKSVNPSNELMWLILQGDRSDGIPNVKSPDDAFITGNTVRMWTSKNVWKHIENNTVFESLIVDKDLKRNFERNKRLIDLRECPQEIKDNIISSYKENKEKLKTKNQLDLFTFFVKNRMKNLIHRVEDFAPYFYSNDSTVRMKIKQSHKSNQKLMNFYQSK